MISASSVLQGATSGILSAISSNNQFNSTPVLYIPLEPITDSTGSLRPVEFAIRLENSAYKVSAQSAISTQVLVSINSDGTTTKQYITDNIAPGPRTWNLSGWLSSSDLMSALFTPINQIGINTSIRNQIDKLFGPNGFFHSRALGRFRDKDGMLWPQVAIESIDFDADPATQNKVPINLVIKEVNVLTLDESGIQTTAVSNDATSQYSPPSDMGTALNRVIQDPTSVLAQVATS